MEQTRSGFFILAAGCWHTRLVATRRIAANIAKLPGLLRWQPRVRLAPNSGSIRCAALTNVMGQQATFRTAYQLYSITSSARATKFSGNSIPVAFAVLVFMTNR